MLTTLDLLSDFDQKICSLKPIVIILLERSTILLSINMNVLKVHIFWKFSQMPGWP